MEDESDARKAKEFEPQYWLDLLNRTFLASPRVLLKGVPSLELNNQLYQSEEERVKAQIETLGPDGLKEAGEKVHRAVESQVLPPNSVLTSVPVADVDTIAYRKHEHYNYTSPSEDFNLTDFPSRFYLDVNLCKRLRIHNRKLNDAQTKSLTKMLSNRVEKLGKGLSKWIALYLISHQ